MSDGIHILITQDAIRYDKEGDFTLSHFVKLYALF